MTADTKDHLSQLVTIVKFSDVINNLNGVRRRVRPIAGKISAQASLFDIFLQNVNDNAEIIEAFTSKI